MNMGMAYEPQPETNFDTKFREQPPQIEKTVPRIKVYIDKIHYSYYVEYPVFESIAFKYDINGETVYEFGDTIYKGDLKGYAVTICDRDNLLRISPKTLSKLYEMFGEGVEYIDLGVQYDDDENFEKGYEMNTYNEMPSDDINPTANLKDEDLVAINDIFSNNNISDYNVSDQFKM